jgi:pimeloyl-ACP methyl ester carboxylesterase
MRWGVAALSAALLLTGCTNPLRSSSSATPSSPQPVPSAMQPLAKFYEQKLSWTDCGSSAKCADLTVPVDYAKPDGPTTQIKVLKVPARKESSRIGSLVVNPGGPGGSGVEYARYADFIVGAPVRRAYDIVGFDPRGVASSSPIDCIPDAKLDDWLAQDPTPDTPAEVATFGANAAAFGEACKANAQPLVEHVSTVEAAKDIDVLRAALGSAKLDYLGKSYGTFLGATYAGLFPTHVGRMVLDGAMAPDLTQEEMLLGQAKGFETATRAWSQSCIDDGCPLGGSVDEVMTGLSALLRKLDATPARVEGDARVKQLTEGWAAYGVAAAMYDQGMWSTLTSALRPLVEKNDGTALMGLADTYSERNVDGTYSGNMMEVISAVSCLDSSDSPDLAVYEKRAKDFSAQAPVFGTFLAWSGVTCGKWPIPATGKPRPIAADGAPPIVVIGTTRDPATPYEWAQRLAAQLSSGVMVTFDGDGHTAYTRSNSCIDNAIDTFYLKDTAPQDGLRC